MNKPKGKSFFFNLSLYRRVFLVFFIICVLITLFSFQYYKSLSSTIKADSERYLQEISRRIGDNIDRIVSDKYDLLRSVATSLELSDVTQLSDAKEMLQTYKAILDCEGIFLIDTDGNAFNLSSTQTFLNFDKSIRQNILSGKESLATAQVIQNKEYILFSTPVKDVAIDNKPIVALAVSYLPSSFDQVLSLTSFNDQSYSQIVTPSGLVVVRSSSPFSLKSGYNIFTTMKDSSLIEPEVLSKVTQQLSSNSSGQINFNLDGKETYMVYTPVARDNWYLLSFFPVAVVNEKSNLLLKSTLLICALIAITFAGLAAALAYVFNNHKHKLEQIAYVDSVTGGNTIQRFYEIAGDMIEKHANTRYALIYTNIIKFKVLNDELGRINCDAILKFFSEFMTSKISENECIGHLSADNFCLLMEFNDETELLNKFGKWHIEAELLTAERKTTWHLPIMEFGIYIIENNSLSFPQIIDRAKLALRESHQNIDSKLRCAFYDDSVRRQLLREKQLEDRMQFALSNEEFIVFLQPKYRLPEEKISGAEALVRWKSADEGMIYPDEFIPLFEKNGFIIELDLFVLETVCKTLRQWIDKGFKPIRISVNCSRLHFKDNKFLSNYVRIVDKYNLDHSFIEIEVTESMVLENSSHLIDIIHNIKDAGFECSMDDFGSGYSSLNLIQSIPVDVLKLDKIFFHGEGVDLRRTEAVVKSIITLAKSLDMETVAEGVEEREQVEMLKSAGCDYIQGYVFARPMDIASFEALAIDNTLSHKEVKRENK